MPAITTTARHNDKQSLQSESLLSVRDEIVPEPRHQPRPLLTNKNGAEHAENEDLLTHDSPASALRSELEALNPSVLRKRAVRSGALRWQLDDADDDDDTKAALVELILKLELPSAKAAARCFVLWLSRSRCLVFSLPARSASLLRPRYHVSVAGPERSAIRRHSARQRTRRHSSQGQRSSRHSGAHRSTTGPAGRQTGSGHAATPPSRTTAATLPPSTVSAIHTR